MIGLVLAAGAGRRLAPLTDALPKTLLPVRGEDTILDLTLANFAAVGIDEAAIVTGFAAEQIERRLDQMQRRHGVRLRTIYNDRALEWNNAYSLWLARALFSDGVLLCNGDTVHPPQVERTVLSARGPALLIAVDTVKPLAEEEMKVTLDDEHALRRINKAIDPQTAAGEYIGVTLIEPAAGDRLATALEQTWRADTTLYYEDGYQAYVELGGRVDVAPIGTLEWVEVDNHADLARARDITCRY
jgi:choline kinase